MKNKNLFITERFKHHSIDLERIHLEQQLIQAYKVVAHEDKKINKEWKIVSIDGLH